MIGTLYLFSTAAAAPYAATAVHVFRRQVLADPNNRGRSACGVGGGGSEHKLGAILPPSPLLLLVFTAV